MFVERLVEVEFVRVALVAVMFVGFIVSTDSEPETRKFVVVALVNVPFVARILSVFVVEALVVEANKVANCVVPVELMFTEFRLFELSVEIFPVVPLNISALLVEAFVVEAFRARVLIEEVALIVPELRVPTIRFEIVEVIADKTFEKKLVDVEFVIVALSEVRDVTTPFVLFRFVAAKFVVVAFVIVALVALRPKTVSALAQRFVSTLSQVIDDVAITAPPIVEVAEFV